MENLWVVTTPQKPWSEAKIAFGEVPEINLGLSNITYQTIGDWGGCFNEMGWAVLSSLEEKARQAVLAKLFDIKEGCGFSFGRVPIGASDFAMDWYSHNETPGDYSMEHFSITRDHKYLLPYLKAAMGFQPDLSVFVSPWSPPQWMKSTGVYNGGSLRWEPQNLKAYALYLLKFVQSYEAQGIKVAQLHVQNEPNSRQIFPSCLWTGEEMGDFIRDYLGPLFKKYLPNCQIWIGTIERPQYEEWAGLILEDAEARSYISGVGYQWAGKGAVQQTYLSWPKLGLMQTENECGDGTNSWEQAHYVFGQIWHYLTNGAQRYMYWNMVLPPGGVSRWGWPQNAMISVDPQTQEVVYNPEYYVMRHFAQYVRPGACRVGLEGSWSAHGLAFQDRQGQLSLVLHNPYQTIRRLGFRAGERTFSVELAPLSFNTFVIPS